MPRVVVSASFGDTLSPVERALGPSMRFGVFSEFLRNHMDGRADRREAARQERPERERVPGCHLGVQDFARRDEPKCVTDERAAASPVPHRRRDLDVHFAEPTQSDADRGDAPLVAVHNHVVSERAGVLHPRMVVLVMAQGKRSAASTARHERYIVTSHDAAGPGHPHQELRSHRPSETVRALHEHEVRFLCGADDGVTSERHDGSQRRADRRKDGHRAVNWRESAFVSMIDEGAQGMDQGFHLCPPAKRLWGEHRPRARLLSTCSA